MPESLLTPASTTSPLLTSPPAPPPAPLQLRAFTDIPALRKGIYDSVFQAVQDMEPVRNDKYTLRLTQPRWVDDEKWTRRQQKEALLSGGTLGRRLRGTWELLDNATGQVTARRDQIVARVPFLTHRGTFINNGSDYTIRHQQRLMPGIFAREKANGEIEAHVNVLPGKGLSHHYFIDPAKSVFYLHAGQANLPLMPVLQALGAQDRQLREAWGAEVFARNQHANDAGAVRKLAEKVLRAKDRAGDDDTTRQALVKALTAMELDDGTTQRTLGQAYPKLSLEAILATTRKLLAISQGKEKVDNRDALTFQRFLSPDDLFAERLRKDHGRIRQNLLHKATYKGNLDHIPTGALTPQLEHVLLRSGLGQAIEEINVLELLDKQTSVTRMGEGGIPSLDAIPDESRNVHGSQTGYIDLVRTPESERAGVDLYLARGARKGSDGRIYAQYHDLKTGQPVWKSPQDVADLNVALPGALRWRTPRVPVLHNGEIDYVPRHEVQLELGDFEDSFSPLGNLVPAKSAVKNQRMAMASRMLTQALSLDKAEAPLVQGAVPGTQGQRSYEEEYARFAGAVHADRGGVVTGSQDGVLQIQYDDGTKDQIELYEHMPFNRKSVTGDTRVWVRQRDNRLWEGPIAEYKWTQGDAVLSIDPVTKQSSWQPITGFVRHRNDKQLVRVRTASGRHVDVTIDHSLVTTGDDGNLVPIYPLDCVLGRTRLPVALNPHFVGDTQVDKARLRGQLAGLYLSEGHAPQKEGPIVIAVTGSARVAQVSRLVRALGLVPQNTKKNVVFRDRVWYRWLVDNFGRLAGGKFVGVDILCLSRTFLHGLVEGYFGGDGCLWADSNEAIQVTAVSTSRRLRDGMVAVLAALGVFSTVWDAPRAHLNEAWNDGFGLRVISRHLAKLRRWFFYADREQKLRSLQRKQYRASPFESVPVTLAARRGLYRALGKVDAFVRKTACQGFVAKPRLAKADAVFGAWGRSDVMWDLVESVEPISPQAAVYDFCVAGSEVFAVNNGLVVHNTFLHQTALVKPGDRFTAGQPLVRSNYTDAQGTLAVGTNLRTAYIPWRGLNFEDAVVVSESAARDRLRSEHAYQFDLKLSEKTQLGKKHYLGLFADKFDRATLAKLDDDGVIRPGEQVEFGQPLLLATRERDQAANRLHKRGQKGFHDHAVLWEHHDPGIVTDVVRGPEGPVVLVKALAPLRVGDKLSGRYGDKGVVAAIIPDAQMPQNAQRQPYELLLNPHGVTTRTNQAQKVEAWLGKVAALTGKPYKIEDYKDIEDLTEFARREMAQRGLNGREDIIDPNTGRRIKNVATGIRFMMKLHHTAESKSQGRGSGAYSQDDAPAKGGASGCFVGETPIRTSYGPVPIRTLVSGRSAGPVVTRTPDMPAGLVREEAITDWFHWRVAGHDLVDVVLADGRVLTATRNHEFLLADGRRVVAADLQPGDALLPYTEVPDA